MLYYLKKYLSLIVLLLINLSLTAADLVIFSYDRPMQLFALLESCELNLSGLTATTVIYRSSDASYQTGYEQVAARFKNVKFVLQQNPPHDFRMLVEKHAFENDSSAYILFAVDDLFIKDRVDLNLCIKTLEQYHAYTFSLRLGCNINYCYMLNQATPLPASHLVAPDIYQYMPKHGQGDWAYPNNLDMNIYRKKDIYQALFASNWHNPNLLESAWAARANLNLSSLYFKQSKIVNIPLNVVQKNWQNRAMHSYSVQELLHRFLAGQVIDLAPILKLNNCSPHMEYEISFKQL